jgi:hypothetical protein
LEETAYHKEDCPSILETAWKLMLEMKCNLPIDPNLLGHPNLSGTHFLKLDTTIDQRQLKTHRLNER